MSGSGLVDSAPSPFTPFSALILTPNMSASFPSPPSHHSAPVQPPQPAWPNSDDAPARPRKSSKRGPAGPATGYSSSGSSNESTLSAGSGDDSFRTMNGSTESLAEGAYCSSGAERQVASALQTGSNPPPVAITRHGAWEPSFLGKANGAAEAVQGGRAGGTTPDQPHDNPVSNTLPSISKWKGHASRSSCSSFLTSDGESIYEDAREGSDDFSGESGSRLSFHTLSQTSSSSTLANQEEPTPPDGRQLPRAYEGIAIDLDEATPTAAAYRKPMHDPATPTPVDRKNAIRHSMESYSMGSPSTDWGSPLFTSASSHAPVDHINDISPTRADFPTPSVVAVRAGTDIISRSQSLSLPSPQKDSRPPISTRNSHSAIFSIAESSTVIPLRRYSAIPAARPTTASENLNGADRRLSQQISASATSSLVSRRGSWQPKPLVLTPARTIATPLTATSSPLSVIGSPSQPGGAIGSSRRSSSALGHYAPGSPHSPRSSISQSSSYGHSTSRSPSIVSLSARSTSPSFAGPLTAEPPLEEDEFQDAPGSDSANETELAAQAVMHSLDGMMRGSISRSPRLDANNSLGEVDSETAGNRGVKGGDSSSVEAILSHYGYDSDGSPVVSKGSPTPPLPGSSERTVSGDIGPRTKTFQLPHLSPPLQLQPSLFVDHPGVDAEKEVLELDGDRSWRPRRRSIGQEDEADDEEDIRASHARWQHRAGSGDSASSDGGALEEWFSNAGTPFVAQGPMDRRRASQEENDKGRGYEQGSDTVFVDIPRTRSAMSGSEHEKSINYSTVSLPSAPTTVVTSPTPQKSAPQPIVIRPAADPPVPGKPILIKPRPGGGKTTGRGPRDIGHGLRRGGGGMPEGSSGATKSSVDLRTGVQEIVPILPAWPPLDNGVTKVIAGGPRLSIDNQSPFQTRQSPRSGPGRQESFTSAKSADSFTGHTSEGLRPIFEARDPRTRVDMPDPIMRMLLSASPPPEVQERKSNRQSVESLSEHQKAELRRGSTAESTPVSSPSRKSGGRFAKRLLSTFRTSPKLSSGEGQDQPQGSRRPTLRKKGSSSPPERPSSRASSVSDQSPKPVDLLMPVMIPSSPFDLPFGSGSGESDVELLSRRLSSTLPSSPKPHSASHGHGGVNERPALVSSRSEELAGLGVHSSPPTRSGAGQRSDVTTSPREKQSSASPRQATFPTGAGRAIEIPPRAGSMKTVDEKGRHATGSLGSAVHPRVRPHRPELNTRPEFDIDTGDATRGATVTLVSTPLSPLNYERQSSQETPQRQSRRGSNKRPASASPAASDSASRKRFAAEPASTMSATPPGTMSLSFAFPNRSRKPSAPKLHLNLPSAASTSSVPYNTAVSPSDAREAEGYSPMAQLPLQSTSIAVFPPSPSSALLQTPATADSFTTAPSESPPPALASPPAPVRLGLQTPGDGPPPALGLAARRQAKKMNKPLSLVVPPPPSAGGLQPPSPLLSSRSLPPSPSFPLSPNPSRPPLTAFIGVEGETDVDRDRTIGRLMRREKEEMAEQMRGGRGMKRRKSIPSGIDIGKTARQSVSGPSGGVLKMIGSKREDLGDGSAPEEDYPYALGPREIIEGIYLGSEENSKDPEVLKAWGIGWVLNVAKEVECPWLGEVIQEEDEEDMAVDSSDPTPQRDGRQKPAHRRTKTQAQIASPAVEPAFARPRYVRPTASTPNLLSAFRKASPPPRLPPIAAELTPVSSSSAAPVPLATVHFPANPRTRRPSLEYLHLKWGHDEADLVEAGKFQAAFDFIDAAKKTGGKVLVHCQCGISRSATVVIAYAMRAAARDLEEGRDGELKGLLGMHDTYSFVKEKSEWVGPNLGLVFQLVAYERTLRGDARSPTSDESPFPPSPDLNHDFRASPRTPISSEGDSFGSSGSSESHLSTPEMHDPPKSAFSGSNKSSGTPTLTVFTNFDRKPLPGRGDPDSVELLSPMVADHLQLSEKSPSSPLVTPGDVAPILPGVYILPTPARPLADLSPFADHITKPPRTPFIEVASLIPPSTSYPSFPTSGRQDSNLDSRKDSISSASTSSHGGSRFAFPPAPKATILTSTPTAAAFSLADRPTAAQVSLMRTASTSSSIEGAESESELRSPLSGTLGRLPFGGQQTPSQRRASHKRVFSVPSL